MPSEQEVVGQLARAIAVALRGPDATVRKSDTRRAKEAISALCYWCRHRPHEGSICDHAMRDDSRCGCDPTLAKWEASR